MNKNIAQLIQLQTIDLEIDQIDNAIKAAQLSLDVRIQAMADREKLILELNDTIKEKEKEKKHFEDEMADKVDHVKDRQSKMMRVQTSREQTALLKEIEDAKKCVKESEDRIVSLMDEIEKLAAQANENANLLKGEKELVAEEKEKVRATIEDINKDKKSKDVTRKQQSDVVEKRLLMKYEMLRQRRNGVAIVNVIQGVCQGCYMNLPPQKFNLLLRGDGIHECPSCQRLMYFQPPEGA